ncbi:hypothetical protein [Paraburkholderia humisilvae]|uniref:ASCH domain-containing protein n=1 Tax=Paraburkholderia humisilvae TaxID=627669 RepID=A0A6J5ESY3_9BURK|nr:hypothetical protein [Paraburkholderia humisilvae]CAB3768272.1 hypothetical protein LMG29542_05826 [Paraburkholderia humisilvae]
MIYATKPVGKVVGEFDIDEVISASPNKLWSSTKEFAGITKQRFNEYFDGREVAHAIKVKDARRYEEPPELPSVLESGVAPQSFCYLS